MSTTIIDLPGNADPVTEIHVWIGVWPDGREAMLSADLELWNGAETRHMPLMSTKRQIVEALRGIAEAIREATQQTDLPLDHVELRTFRVVQNG